MGGGEREGGGQSGRRAGSGGCSANRVVHGPRNPGWMEVTTQQNREKEGSGREREKREERGREREREKSSYFTPMQHAEEIQVPFKLHNCISKTLNNTLVGLIHKGY